MKSGVMYPAGNYGRHIASQSSSKRTVIHIPLNIYIWVAYMQLYCDLNPQTTQQFLFTLSIIVLKIFFNCVH